MIYAYYIILYNQYIKLSKNIIFKNIFWIWLNEMIKIQTI